MGETLAMILLTAVAVVAFMASEAVREIERRSEIAEDALE